MKRLLFVMSMALAAQNAVTIDVPGDKQWTDSGIELEAGDRLTVEVEGKISYLGKETGPEGMARGWMDMIRAFPLNDAKRGALIGRVGESDATRAFLIGAKTDRNIAVKGRLFLGINHSPTDRATGSFSVKVTRAKGAAPVVDSSKLLSSLVKISATQHESIPRRVVDAAGTEGDRTNFMIVGSELHVVSALEKAGWVKVDRSVKDSVFRGILVSVSKQAYVTLPMSELQVFGRPQDYGFAQGDPLKVIAARHHFRIWKAPFTAGGRTVWVGAGTHDVGFDKDQRNGKVTHKIDPDTDKERDYIGRSLQETGEVLSLDYMLRKDPVKEAKTAHGQAFRSDGRTLMIYLKPDEADSSQQFNDLFCTVLAKNNPDAEKWDACAAYVEGGGKTDAPLP